MFVSNEVHNRVNVHFATEEEKMAQAQLPPCGTWQKMSNAWAYLVNSWNIIVPANREDPTRSRSLHALPTQPGKYAEIVPWNNIGMGNAYSVTDPDIQRAVMQKPRNGTAKDPFSGGINVDVIAANTGHHNIATVSIAEHLKFRTFLRPLFSPEAVSKRVDAFRQAALELTAKWSKTNEPIDLTLSMKFYALEMISKHYLGLNVDSEKLAHALETFNEHSVEKALNKNNPKKLKQLEEKYGAAEKAAKQFITDSVNGVIANESDKNNIIHQMKESGKFSEEEIHDTIKGLFFGGWETSSSTLTYGVYILSLEKNREWVRKIRDELVALSFDCPASFVKKLDNCEALNQVYLELMRMNPAAFSVLRTVAHGDIVIERGPNQDPIYAKNGTVFANNILLGLRDQGRWGANADEFDPSRFADPFNGPEAKEVTSLVFGAGQNICLGRHFARYEILTLLAVLCQNIDLIPVTQSVKQVTPMSASIVATDSKNPHVFIQSLKVKTS